MNISDSVVKESHLPPLDDSRPSSHAGFRLFCPICQLNTYSFCLQVKQLQKVNIFIAQKQWVRFSHALIFANGTQFFWPPYALVCSHKTFFCFHSLSSVKILLPY